MLSRKTAQFDRAYNSIRQDPWVLDNLHKLPPQSILDYIQDTYQLSVSAAEELAKMLTREFALPPAPPLSLKHAQRDELPSVEFEKWVEGAKRFIEQQRSSSTFHSPSEAIGAFEEFAEEAKGHANLSEKGFAKFKVALHNVLAKQGILPTEIEEAGAVAGNIPSQLPEAKPPQVPKGEASFEAIEKIINESPTLTPDYILDLYEKAKRMRNPVAREKLMQQVKQLSKKLGQRLGQAKEIVIPATKDNPFPRTVQLPAEETPVAPEVGKVVTKPTTVQEQKEVLDTSLTDQQKTRQEQLANSFQAMEVVLKDFSKAMFGIELNEQYSGKLLEKIIDAAADLAADQTADTVKQLASPFLPQ